MRALRNLLTHNPELLELALHKSYDNNPSIAAGYFQVNASCDGIAFMWCESDEDDMLRGAVCGRERPLRHPC